MNNDKTYKITLESPICVTITNTTLKDLQLYFNVSQVSLLVENSTFSKTRLVIRSGLRSKPVTIDNAIFSDLKNLSDFITKRRRDPFGSYGATCGIDVHDNATVNIRNTRFHSNTYGFITENLISCYRSNVNVMNVTMGNNHVNLIEASGCNLRLTETIIINNASPLKLLEFSSHSSAFVSDSVFDSNSMFLKVSKSNLTVTGTIFTQNIVDARSTDLSALVLIQTKSSVLLTNCSFSSNNVSKSGFAELVSVRFNSILYVVNTQFLSNRGGKYRGVIGTWSKGDSVHFINCVFEENHSVESAIVIISQLSTTGCSFKGNRASGSGGAITVAGGGQYTDTGSEFRSNKAGTKGKVNT